MKNYNVHAIYFSPTHTSEKGVKAIASALNENFTSIDLTIIGTTPSKSEFRDEDIVVFGAPVYSSRVFKGAQEAFKKLKGNNTPCVITITYGNRGYEDALVHFAKILKEHGFIPIAAAALIGEHTFGEIQIGRPNEADIAQDKDFGKKILEKLDNISEVILEGEISDNDGGNGANFVPSTLNSCVNCGLCAKICTMQAIDKNDVTSIDTDKCIACFRCIKSCPVHAKKCTEQSYIEFAEAFTKRLSKRLENEYFI